MISPIVVFWNCRGAGSIQSVRHLNILMRQYQPNIVILVETRVHGNQAQ